MKTKKLYIRSILAVLTFLLLTGSVFAQKSFKLSDFSNVLASNKSFVRMIPVEDLTNLNIRVETLVNSHDHNSEIGLEKWMFGDNHFTVSNVYLSEVKESNRIESWMLDEDYFLTDKNGETMVPEEEESNIIENWMMDDSYFDK